MCQQHADAIDAGHTVIWANGESREARLAAQGFEVPDGRAHTVGDSIGLKRDAVVEHPPHYTFGKYEVIDIIEDWKLGFHLGNAVKYIARAGKKGDALEDLKKARWYLDREIARRGGDK